MKIWIFKSCTFKVHFEAIVKYIQIQLDEQCIFQFVWTEKLYWNKLVCISPN